MIDFNTLQVGALVRFNRTGNVGLFVEVNERVAYVVVFYLSKGVYNDYNNISEGERVCLNFDEIAHFEVL